MFLYYIYSERTDGSESIFIFIIEYTAIVTNTLVGGGVSHLLKDALMAKKYPCELYLQRRPFLHSNWFPGELFEC